MGEEALRRQREAYERERTCTCEVGAEEKKPKLHKPGCKARPLTRAGRL
jgi:hypothetical protein